MYLIYIHYFVMRQYYVPNQLFLGKKFLFSYKLPHDCVAYVVTNCRPTSKSHISIWCICNFLVELLHL